MQVHEHAIQTSTFDWLSDDSKVVKKKKKASAELSQHSGDTFCGGVGGSITKQDVVEVVRNNDFTREMK